jgi:GxxExxY protein
MEIHRELGKGYAEAIYKDAFVVELSRAGIQFSREKNYEITYKGVILPHYYKAIPYMKVRRRLTGRIRTLSIQSACG